MSIVRNNVRNGQELQFVFTTLWEIILVNGQELQFVYTTLREIILENVQELQFVCTTLFAFYQHTLSPFENWWRHAQDKHYEIQQ